LPVGEEAGFRGVVDLLTDVAITYDSGSPVETPIPEDQAATEQAGRAALVEGIVVGDDDLMERYLEGEVPDAKQLEETLAQGVASATVFPVVCGSCLKSVAIDRLAKFICEIGPAPTDRPPTTVRAADRETEVPCDPNGQPLVQVF